MKLDAKALAAALSAFTREQDNNRLLHGRIPLATAIETYLSALSPVPAFYLSDYDANEISESAGNVTIVATPRPTRPNSNKPNVPVFFVGAKALAAAMQGPEETVRHRSGLPASSFHATEPEQKPKRELVPKALKAAANTYLSMGWPDGSEAVASAVIRTYLEECEYAMYKDTIPVKEESSADRAAAEPICWFSSTDIGALRMPVGRNRQVTVFRQDEGSMIPVYLSPLHFTDYVEKYNAVIAENEVLKQRLIDADIHITNVVETTHLNSTPAPSALNRLGYLSPAVVEHIQSTDDKMTIVTIDKYGGDGAVALYVQEAPDDADLILDVEAVGESHFGSGTPSAIYALNSTLQDDLENALAVYAERTYPTLGCYQQMAWAEIALYFELTNDQYVTGERRLLKKHREEV